MAAISGIGGVPGRRVHDVTALAMVLLAAGSCGGDATGPVGERPTITTTVLADAAVGVPYVDVLTAVGGQAPHVWSVVDGTLPDGLTLAPSTGEIRGTPTAPGTSVFSIRVTGDDGLGSTKPMSLTVGIAPLSMLTRPLPDAVLGVDYLVDLQAIGGSGPYAWTTVSGSLPGGLALGGGRIFGLPVVAGYFPVGIQVESGGETTAAQERIRVYPTQNLRIFLDGLPSWIASSLKDNQDLLPRNPHLASEIQAKLELLSTPDLEASILDDALFSEEETTTLDGRSIPVAVVFPADTMRWGVLEDLERIPPTVSVLEGFMGVPWPRDFVHEWYGFRMGNSGGGGSLFMEDRGTYADRGAPYDVILGHELAHSYVGHEGLTQFLEVYSYNLVETGSTDLSTWPWKRALGDAPYVSFAPANDGVWALMDIYQLIGPAAMGRAYARIHTIGAEFGLPLSAAARQAFIDEAPSVARNQVAALVLRI